MPVTLPAVPQGGSSVSPLSQNTTQSSAVSVSPHNTPAQQSIGATFVSVTNDLIRTNVTPKLVAVTTSSALPQSGALESPIVGVGSDSVPRIMATANSVSPSVMVGPAVGVGGSISVLGDGHAPVVNSRVDGHKADSANVLPVGEMVSGVLSVSGASSSSSSVVEFSASASSPVGEHDINVITVGDAGEGLLFASFLFLPSLFLMTPSDMDASLCLTQWVSTKAYCLILSYITQAEMIVSVSVCVQGHQMWR